MTADEKNSLIDAAKATMTTAIALVAAEVFSGLAAAPLLLSAAANMIAAAGDGQHANQAGQRAAECPAILMIPWPFIYAGSSAWIAAVRQLRDSLPHYIQLEPVARRRERETDEEKRTAHARAGWDALTEPQRSVLEKAGLTPEMLRPLGSV